MNFLDNLQSHKGGLVRLKTQLFWYGGRGYDNNPGRICLILDAATTAAAAAAVVVRIAAAAPTAAGATTALLLIDGSPQWIWMAEKDVEVL